MAKKLIAYRCMRWANVSFLAINAENGWTRLTSATRIAVCH